MEKPSCWPARLKMLGMLLICALPVVMSYLTYYFFQPTGRTNYGELLAPYENVSALSGFDEKGVERRLSTFAGRWVLLMVGASACQLQCQQQLYALRQLRLATGVNQGRVERLWVPLDAGSPSVQRLSAYPGLCVVRPSPESVSRLRKIFSVPRPEVHIWLIDPKGELVMKFPQQPDLSKVKRDLNRLLLASEPVFWEAKTCWGAPLPGGS